MCAAREPRRFNGLCGICSELGHLSCHCLLQRDRIYSDVPTLSSPPKINRSGRGSSSAPRFSSSSSHSRSFFRRSCSSESRSLSVASFSTVLGFHGPHGMRQQGIRVGRAHSQAPRLGPRASALQCVELVENLQFPRRSPHKRGKIPAFVAVAPVTAAAATAAVYAIEIDLPGETDGVRGLSSAPLLPRL